MCIIIILVRLLVVRKGNHPFSYIITWIRTRIFVQAAKLASKNGTIGSAGPENIDGIAEKWQNTVWSIGEKVNGSGNTVKARIDKMFQTGVINKFVTLADPKLFHYNIAFLLIPGISAQFQTHEWELSDSSATHEQ